MRAQRLSVWSEGLVFHEVDGFLVDLGRTGRVREQQEERERREISCRRQKKESEIADLVLLDEEEREVHGDVTLDDDLLALVGVVDGGTGGELLAEELGDILDLDLRDVVQAEDRGDVLSLLSLDAVDDDLGFLDDALLWGGSSTTTLLTLGDVHGGGLLG